jgi:predicted phage terminase large subunit-like protein
MSKGSVRPVVKAIHAMFTGVSVVHPLLYILIVNTYALNVGKQIMSEIKKVKQLEDYIATIDYDWLNNEYVPSVEAMEFITFIKLVNGEKGEENLTPVMHLHMLDGLIHFDNVLEVVFRGGAKTTVIHEYAFLYMATYGEFFHFGPVDVAMYVSDTMENGVKNMRNQLQFRWEESEFLQQYVPYTKFVDDGWEFINAEGHKLFVKGFAAMTGVRGFKKYGKRPTWCGFDDLMSDKNSKSPTILADIENVVYKAARQAMHPTKRKTVWTGTPFNKSDSLYKAAGSKGWETRAYPLCEKFPCSKEEFKGAWEDRFTYESTVKEYELLAESGKIQAFNQELMLRITSDEDRLVLDSDIMWYDRNVLIHNKGIYNFYITTDWATSENESADFSVTSVWAINNKGFWFLVDGVCARQTMEKNIDDLFRFAQEYKDNLQSAGIEVSGQQGGFIQWIQKEMMERNIWFNLASENNNNKLGIRPNGKKLVRFQTVVPWFKAKRMFFPSEFRNSHPLMIEMEDELKFVTKQGFKSAHDDALDTVSMLSVMNAWKPTHDSKMVKDEVSGIWDDHRFRDDNTVGGIDSYLV